MCDGFLDRRELLLRLRRISSPFCLFMICPVFRLCVPTFCLRLLPEERPAELPLALCESSAEAMLRGVVWPSPKKLLYVVIGRAIERCERVIV